MGQAWDQVGTLVANEPTDTEVRQARKTVAEQSRGPADAVQIMLALGLVEDEDLKPQYVPQESQ